MRELDGRIIRLSVETEEQLRLITTLKVSLGLPVLADIRSNLALAASVAQSQADGLVFTCTGSADAERVMEAIAPTFEGLVVVRTIGEDLSVQAEIAAEAVEIMCQHNRRNLFLTPVVGRASRFADIAAVLRKRTGALVRAELEFPGKATTGRVPGLGALVHLPNLVLVGLPAPGGRSSAGYIKAVDAITRLEQHEERTPAKLRLVAHMTQRAICRVVTRPVRVLHEMESEPTVFMRSLPSRLVSKPERVMGEILRLSHRIS